jgi:hypothetical protein
MSTPLADQLREYFDALQKQVTHLKDAADQAREETSAQVGARIEQAKTDVAAVIRVIGVKRSPCWCAG